MILERLYMACVMFGELHQIYLLANMLGMSGHKFFVDTEWEFSLESVMRVATLSIVITVIYATAIHHSFTLTRNVWCIFVSLMQIYFIRSSTSTKNRHRGDEVAMASTAINAIRIYEKLSMLQLLPSAINFTERLCALFDIDVIHGFTSAAHVLDVLCNYLFYLKILLIKESSAEVKVEVVHV